MVVPKLKSQTDNFSHFPSRRLYIFFSINVFCVITVPKRYNISLNDDIAEKLEREVKENFRGKKGAISIIVETALVKYFEGRGNE